MAGRKDPRVERLAPRERAYVERLEPGQREIVVTTLARYRRTERLAVGDELPALAASRLDDGSPVELRSLVVELPLLLVFGSFT